MKDEMNGISTQFHIPDRSGLILSLVRESDEFTPRAGEIIFAHVDPAVGGVEAVGVHRLIDEHTRRFSCVLNIVECAFDCGMIRWHTDVHRIHSRRGALRKSPLCRAGWRRCARFDITHRAVGCVGGGACLPAGRG